MPEMYGEFVGEADVQYVGCVVCGNLVDLFDSHPMFQEEVESAVEESETRTYHFDSDDCLQIWKRRRDIGE